MEQAPQPPKKESESAVSAGSKISFLSDMLESGKSGIVCLKISSISASLTSRNGWQYRKLGVHDRSMNAEMLISEAKYSDWKFELGDAIICDARSNGVDNEGRLALFFNEFLGPFDSARILFDTIGKLYEAKTRSGERMKSNETVYQISAREARSLLELIKLWASEGKPQHYTKWCQMHQIVATNLYYMGLVKRTASMSGYYYPTQEALDFFEGKKNFPKKKVFVRDSNGKHLLVGDEGEAHSFSEYLSDYADRESALGEYNEALNAYRERIKALREQNTEENP